MKSIRFSEDELEFLRNHYEFELEEAENYVSDIHSILKKLGSMKKEVIVEKPLKAKGKKRGRPKQVKPVEVKAELPKPEEKKPLASKKKAPLKKKKAVAKKKATAKPRTETPVAEQK